MTDNDKDLIQFGGWLRLPWLSRKPRRKQDDENRTIRLLVWAIVILALVVAVLTIGPPLFERLLNAIAP